jgi:hypothetical protein
VRLAEESFEVGVCAVSGGDFIIVRDVIAGVIERGPKAGVDPDGVNAEIADIVEFMDEAGNVADAVAVAVAEALRVDLVENCVFEPFGSYHGLILRTLLTAG